jgi:hypothetical protein
MSVRRANVGRSPSDGLGNWTITGGVYGGEAGQLEEPVASRRDG